jgi:hypothetical protein
MLVIICWLERGLRSVSYWTNGKLLETSSTLINISSLKVQESNSLLVSKNRPLDENSNNEISAEIT